MNLPLRARISLWYFAVLIIAFASFAWITDYGFQHSIESTLNDASRANLDSIQNVLFRAVPSGTDEVKDQLSELSGLWSGGALLEVAGADGKMVFQSPAFAQPDRALPSFPVAQVGFFTANLDWLQYRIASRAITLQGQTFYVRAAIPTEPFDQALDRFRLILKRTLPALVVLASLIGYWLSGRALSPINQIIESARRIDAQNLSERLVVSQPHDELRRLSETLNEMLARIDSSVTRITQFTADASHDLRTPVAVIRTDAELALRRSRTPEQYKETLSRILATSIEATHLIENLLALARADAGAANLHFERIDLIPHLRNTCAKASILASGKGIQFVQQLPAAPAWIHADPAAMERVFLVVFENAVKYTPAGGQIAVQFHNGNGSATVEIQDTGIGISEKDAPHVFERFYRADSARAREPHGGYGLGLAIARWIVDMHSGSIHLQTVQGQGSVFRISFPVAANN
jgi:heavy metal sensor kinase